MRLQQAAGQMKHAKPSRWTEERKAALRANWHLPSRQLLALLNSMPGDPLSTEMMRSYGMNVLGLPPRYAAEAEIPTPTQAARQDHASAMRNPERSAKMRELWSTRLSLREILHAVNAVPGEAPFAAPSSIRSYALSLGLPFPRPGPAETPAGSDAGDPATPEPEAEAPQPRAEAHAKPAEAPAAPITAVPPPAEPEPAPAGPEVVEAKLNAAQDKAVAMLSKGTDPSVVAMHTKLPLREVFRLQGELRMRLRQAAEEVMA